MLHVYLYTGGILNCVCSQIRLVGGGADHHSLKDLIHGVIGFPGYVQRQRTYGRSHEWKVSGYHSMEDLSI